MWKIVGAADLPPVTDNTSDYLVFAAAVIASLASVLIAIINTSRKERTSPAPPAPGVESGDGSLGKLRERVAINEAKLDSTETALEELEDIVDLIDKRQYRAESQIDRIEQYLSRQNPDGWR